MQNLSQEAKAVREIYLAAISREIQTRLEPLAAFDSLQEMRDHLDSMAAAYEEMGMPAEEAMKAAVARFGSAAEIGTGVAEQASTGFSTKAMVFFLQILGTGTTGVMLMLLTDVMAVTAHLVHQATWYVDISIGGIFGAVIGAISWLPWKGGIKFSVGLMALSQIFLLLWMRPVMSIANPLFVAIWFATTSFNIFAVATVGLHLSRKLRSIFGSRRISIRMLSE